MNRLLPIGLGMLLDGASVVEKELELLKDKVRDNTKAVVIQVGDNKASNVYVRNKVKLAEDLGIEVEVIALPGEVEEAEVLKVIDKCNKDNSISGILVQLPLPKHIDEERIANAIYNEKDIDCFSSYNLGEVIKGNEEIAPCTPRGIITLLNHYDLEIEGKTIVVVGRSNIVGKPLVNMLINRGATVISCNSKTPPGKIIRYMFECDIFISAIGQPKYFNKDLIRKYINKDFNYICPVMVDVGINRDDNNKLCGDISEDVRPYVDYITPVPGGVGKTTVLELMRNIINCK